MVLLLTLQRRKVLGNEYVDVALARGTSDFSRPAQEYVTRNVWDSIWGHPGLAAKYHLLVVISYVSVDEQCTYSC